MSKTKLKIFKRVFNYHNNTYRFGNSEYASDEEMLQVVAKSMGILMLGFSEHMPNHDLILPDKDHSCYYLK
jgi:hypothetical protein